MLVKKLDGIPGQGGEMFMKRIPFFYGRSLFRRMLPEFYIVRFRDALGTIYHFTSNINDMTRSSSECILWPEDNDAIMVWAAVTCKMKWTWRICGCLCR